MQKFNANPGSDYGIVTTPTTVDNNETISIPAGRQAVVGTMTVADGSTLEIADGAELGVIGGGSLSQAVMKTNKIVMNDTSDGKTYEVVMTNGTLVVSEAI